MNIVIVGGGTAGWMTANLLAQRWKNSSVQITLLESSKIGTIGVGEGTTPYFRHFFQQLGIEESDWMPYCQASYKTGIEFSNWSTTAGYQSYFHPFFSELDRDSGEAFFYQANLRRRGAKVQANPADFFVASYLASEGLAPKPRNKFPFDIDYAYHFDAKKLAEFLKNIAVSKAVQLIDDEVQSVVLTSAGGIDHLTTAQGRRIAADFFIDCTGFQALLLSQLPETNYHSYQDRLFNDSACVIQTHADPKQRLRSYTESAALQHGWAWQIPLPQRSGHGYVYSSKFVSHDSAEREFRQYLQLPDHSEVRQIKMKVGRQQKHWQQNCLAIGLSQGFIEPLEATALMLVQYSIEQFLQRFEPALPQTWCSASLKFNSEINRMFDGVADYVQCHYLLNNRNDTDYWQQCRIAPTSDLVSQIIECWTSGAELELVLQQQADKLVYFRPSWYCILAGMGHFTSAQVPASGIPLDQIKADCRQRLTMFREHRQALQLLRQTDEYFQPQ